jgi:hypothetical protein
MSNANRMSLYRKLIALRDCNAHINFKKSQLQLKFPVLSDLLDSPIEQSASEMVKNVAKLARCLVDKDLSHVKYLPIIVSMHQFIYKNFNHLLKDEVEARSLLVVDAMNLLPTCDRIVGLELLQRFLEAWEVLRVAFRSFQFCPNELRMEDEADAMLLNNANHERTVIPVFKLDNLTISCVAELNTTEHESYTARMLETVFIKKIADVCNSSIFENLANDELINPAQCILDSKLKVMKFSNISASFNVQNLLTGPYRDSHRKEAFDSYLISHSNWVTNSSLPCSPPPFAGYASSCDVKEYLKREKKR